jgi:hypothetical protein
MDTNLQRLENLHLYVDSSATYEEERKNVEKSPRELGTCEQLPPERIGAYERKAGMSSQAIIHSYNSISTT